MSSYKIMVASEDRPYTQQEIYSMSECIGFPVYIPMPIDPKDYFLFSKQEAEMICDWIHDKFNTEDILIKRESNGFVEYLSYQLLNKIK